MLSPFYTKYKHIDNAYLYENSKKLYKLHLKIWKSLNTKQRKALLAYNSGTARKLNSILRENRHIEMFIYELFENMKDYIQKDINIQIEKKTKPIITTEQIEKSFIDVLNKPLFVAQHIDSIFDKIKNKYPRLALPLFRGIQMRKTLKPSKIGSIIKFSDYLSTSISPSVAINYQGCGKYPCCIMVLHITNKVPYIPLYKNPKMLEKHEVLLPRNTSWRIVKKYKSSIDLNQGLVCNYDDIIKTQKKKITIYELKAIKYQGANKKIETIDAKKYNNNFNNNKFFKVVNKIPIYAK